MNSLKKVVKFVQTKFIQLCLLIMLIIVLTLLALLWLSPRPLPKAVDIELRRKQSAPLCQKLLCINQLIQKYRSNAEVSQIHEMCPNYSWSKTLNKTFKAYEERKVDWTFMRDYHGHTWYHNCHRKCGIDGPFRYYISYHKYILQMYKAWLQLELCRASLSLKNCMWRAYALTFTKYFSYFSIPLTIIFNYFNLTTLLRLLGISAGPALYLHTAEIVTDGLLNIITGGVSLHVFSRLDLWSDTCASFRYISLNLSLLAVKSFVTFLNQAFLVGLLADRYYALSKPVQYNNLSDHQMKKRAKSYIVKIVLSSFILYLPFILSFTFAPIFSYWLGKLYLDYIFVIFHAIITFSLLICEIIFGLFVEKKFRKFIKNRMEMNQESQVELLKKERDKQLLLAWTIGLNVITGLISAAFFIIARPAFFRLLGYSGYPWWSRILQMAGPVLTFINGNGCLVIHIIFVKSYRKAFKATKFGRLLFGRQQVHSATQHQ